MEKGEQQSLTFLDENEFMISLGQSTRTPDAVKKEEQKAKEEVERKAKEEKEKAEQEKIKEELKAKLEEEMKAKLEEERKAKEEEERKAKLEEERKAKEEEERKAKEQEERKAKEEEERKAKEEEERKAKEEQEKVTREGEAEQEKAAHDEDDEFAQYQQKSLRPEENKQEKKDQVLIYQDMSRKFLIFQSTQDYYYYDFNKNEWKDEEIEFVDALKLIKNEGADKKVETIEEVVKNQYEINMGSNAITIAVAEVQIKNTEEVIISGGRNPETKKPVADVFRIKFHKTRALHKIKKSDLTKVQNSNPQAQVEEIENANLMEDELYISLPNLQARSEKDSFLTSMPQGRYLHQTVKIYENKKSWLIVLGGKTVDEQITNSVIGLELNTSYANPINKNEWINFPSMKEPRSNFGAIATDNFIYVFGGVKGVNGFQPILVENFIEKFSLAKQSWEIVDIKMTSLACFGFTSDLAWNIGGKSNEVYILGGTDGSSFKSDLWKLSIKQDSIQATNVDFAYYEKEDGGQLMKEQAKVVLSKLQLVKTENGEKLFCYGGNIFNQNSLYELTEANGQKFWKHHDSHYMKTEDIEDYLSYLNQPSVYFQ